MTSPIRLQDTLLNASKFVAINESELEGDWKIVKNNKKPHHNRSDNVGNIPTLPLSHSPAGIIAPNLSRPSRSLPGGITVRCSPAAPPAPLIRSTARLAVPRFDRGQHDSQVQIARTLVLQSKTHQQAPLKNPKPVVSATMKVEINQNDYHSIPSKSFSLATPNQSRSEHVKHTNGSATQSCSPLAKIKTGTAKAHTRPRILDLESINKSMKPSTEGKSNIG